MNSRITLRTARLEERLALEELQRRASLEWEEYREALLAHPEAIELPVAQIEAGQVTVAEENGRPLGFSVVLPREDGDAELDGLFVEPRSWGRGVGRGLVEHAAARARTAGCTSSPIRARRASMRGVASSGPARHRHGSDRRS